MLNVPVALALAVAWLLPLDFLRPCLLRACIHPRAFLLVTCSSVAPQGKPKKKPAWHKNVAAMSRGVIVESSPRYILSPIAPYRMRMVLPRAKLVVVLRDPTVRCEKVFCVVCQRTSVNGRCSRWSGSSTYLLMKQMTFVDLMARRIPAK